MAHWAELDENNVVLRVLVTDNNDPDEGYGFLTDAYGGTWIQTSYNENIRYNFAAVGHTYDADADAFIPPAPYPSWTLNTTSYRWEPPVAEPDEPSEWVEETQSWFTPTVVPAPED